jgi:hypothetical protein
LYEWHYTASELRILGHAVLFWLRSATHRKIRSQSGEQKKEGRGVSHWQCSTGKAAPEGIANQIPSKKSFKTVNQHVANVDVSRCHSKYKKGA